MTLTHLALERALERGASHVSSRQGMAGNSSGCQCRGSVHPLYSMRENNLYGPALLGIAVVIFVDVMNLNNIHGLGAPVASIGRAWTFD
jgi:hypothetical protein